MRETPIPKIWQGVALAPVRGFIAALVGDKKATKVYSEIMGITQSAIVDIWKISYTYDRSATAAKPLSIRQRAEWLHQQGGLGRTLPAFDELNKNHQRNIQDKIQKQKT